MNELAEGGERMAAGSTVGSHEPAGPDGASDEPAGPDGAGREACRTAPAPGDAGSRPA